ncbi:cytochrome C [Phenylobacterium hankyongense]|uniref:Cytochrome C n=2 Tax=Phenylobacterium hankyongense TaxID=1813876 RepID=A0A328AZA4_9CAUL|nr:cytochrome C [Phenylobacterium hankyongense]
MVIGLGVLAVALALFVRSAQREARLLRADPATAGADPQLMAFARPAGASIYRSRCASCHGAAGKGDPSRGVPNLTDTDWLYGGGEVAEIERVVEHGVRARDPKTQALAVMPAYASPVPAKSEAGLQPLSPADIRDMTEFLQYLGHHAEDPAAAARGSVVYHGRGGCYDCHAQDAQGDAAIGAPNLTDDVWLYGGGSRPSVFNSIAYGHAGICPAWATRLRPAAIRQVALYVYSLSHRRSSAHASR